MAFLKFSNESTVQVNLVVHGLIMLNFGNVKNPGQKSLDESILTWKRLSIEVAKIQKFYTDTKMYPTDAQNFLGFCQIFHDPNKIQKHFIPHFKGLIVVFQILNEIGSSMNPKLAMLTWMKRYKF